MRASCPTTGAASARSRPLPWGRPSTMSTRTKSASPASAMRWAVVAPTFPAPMTVTLLRAIAFLLKGSISRIREPLAFAGGGYAEVGDIADPDRARVTHGLADAACVLL